MTIIKYPYLHEMKGIQFNSTRALYKRNCVETNLAEISNGLGINMYWVPNEVVRPFTWNTITIYRSVLIQKFK